MVSVACREIILTRSMKGLSGQKYFDFVFAITTSFLQLQLRFVICNFIFAITTLFCHLQLCFCNYNFVLSNYNFIFVVATSPTFPKGFSCSGYKVVQSKSHHLQVVRLLIDLEIRTWPWFSKMFLLHFRSWAPMSL